MTTIARMQTTTATLHDARYDLAALCAQLVKESQWFSVMPLPFGRYEMQVREDYGSRFLDLVQSCERGSCAAVSQDELTRIVVSLRHCHDQRVDFGGEGIAPLSDEEVDELCERLGSGLVVNDGDDIDASDMSPAP